MKREIVKKPLEWFKFDNVRQKFEKDALIELGKSLRRWQITPLLVRPDGTVIEGNRRALAAGIEGLTELDCIIITEDLTPSELRAIQIVAATQREGLTGHELYLGVYEVVQCNPGKTLKEVAEMVSMDQAMVTKILAASKLEPEAMQAFADGKLSTSDVYLISRAEKRPEQLALLEAKLNGSIGNRESLARRVRQQKNGEQVKVERFRAVLASGATVTVASSSLDVCGLIDVLSEALKLAKKADRERIGIKAFEAALRDQAKA